LPSVASINAGQTFESRTNIAMDTFCRERQPYPPHRPRDILAGLPKPLAIIPAAGVYAGSASSKPFIGVVAFADRTTDRKQVKPCVSLLIWHGEIGYSPKKKLTFP
jgi:hypothetical protein